MVNKKQIFIAVLALAVIAITYFSYAAYAPAGANQNGTVSLTNSSLLNAYNGTGTNATLMNSTLNGNVSEDQNYSTLSSGNIPSPP